MPKRKINIGRSQNDAKRIMRVVCIERQSNNDDVVNDLQDMLNTHNRHVKSFKTAIESVPPNVTD